MAITKEQWKEIERNLSFSHGFVELTCDGYNVSLHVMPVDTLKYGIFVYVGGQFKGIWMAEDCQERRRFLCPVERHLYTAKERKNLIAIYGGKRAKKAYVERVNAKLTVYRNWWSNATALRRHLQKNNQHIDVVRIGCEVAA